MIVCTCGRKYHGKRAVCACGLVLEHGKASTIPGWVRAVARWRVPGEAGVGDTFHRLATSVGADRVMWLAKWFGVDCGCSGRRQLWNEQYPYDGKIPELVAN